MVERYTHSHPIPIRWLALVTALNVLVREASCTADHEADASNPPPFLVLLVFLVTSLAPPI